MIELLQAVRCQNGREKKTADKGGRHAAGVGRPQRGWV